ncbi:MULTISPECIES: TrwN protein [Bartonella]|uniref:TrwN protein n=1 Tax=Bartonella TaxID=773 RepID=UPI00236133DB|nr:MULTISPECIES: TrwN protein [Bartonella]
MIFLDFTMFAAAYMPNTPNPVFSTLIEQRARDNVHITDKNDKLFRQLSLLKEETAIIKQFKQNRHNFDAIFKQIDVENMKWLSFFGSFDFCRNLAAVQNTLTYCYEQKTSKYIFEKATLQSVLSFYSTENLSSGTDTQTITSYIGEGAVARRDKDLQEPVRLKKEEPKQATKVDSLPLSLWGLEDAFTHKESSSRDAFATGDSSSPTKQLN